MVLSSGWEGKGDRRRVAQAEVVALLVDADEDVPVEGAEAADGRVGARPVRDARPAPAVVRVPGDDEVVGPGVDGALVFEARCLLT